MTVEEIAASLPNGFHDARIDSISINYVKREVSIDLEVWMAESQEDSEVYRAAELKLLDFLFCVIEPPDATSTYHQGKALWVDAGSGRALRSSAELPGSLPKGAFVHWFFVNDWNAFIHVSAMDARISWR